MNELLFTHGRESYRRNCYMVNYTFYKNVYFVMPQFWFGLYSALSGQIMYEKWLYQIFNIFFSAYPIMVYSLFDREFTRDELQTDPKCYFVGPRYELFNTKLFWGKWLMYSFAQACLIFVIIFWTFKTAIGWGGHTGGLYLEGQIVYAAVVYTVNLKILTDSYSINFLIFFLVVLSIGLFYGFFWVFNLVPADLAFDTYF